MDDKSSVFQSHLILVGCARLQVEVAGCRFVCSQCWFAVPDRRNQSRSKNAMIAGRGHFDCRPLQLVARLNAMAVEINDRAVKASERRVSEVVRAAGEQREQAERELADASQTVDDLEHQLDDAQEANQELSTQLAQLKDDKQALAVELAQVKERLAAVEQAAKVAADRATTQDKELRVELEAHRRGEQLAREREAQAVGAHSAMEKQHVEDAAVCQDLRSELQDVRTELRALSASLAHSEAVSKSRGEDLDQAKRDLKELKNDLKAANQKASEAVGREQSALAQLKVLTESASKAKTTKPTVGQKPKE
ncbi:hypothetical protein [Pseudomonas amygdali]